MQPLLQNIEQSYHEDTISPTERKARAANLPTSLGRNMTFPEQMMFYYAIG